MKIVNKINTYFAKKLAGWSILVTNVRGLDFDDVI